ncbi:hypothetical protein WJX73_004268 [Symbiochloris irregularis]|uniref:Flavanone 4-reductase n=1 Tax=Symbiochloris irregularis TaxID=706552 RepID=A0AAW1NRX4_9CHLO
MGLQVDTVLVTGAAGFLGMHLTKHLLEQGFTVRATSRTADSKAMYPLPELAKCLPGTLEMLSLDILDAAACERAAAGAVYIFHVAGPDTLTTGDADKDQELIYRPAIEGTRNILHAAAKAKVKRLVITSSLVAVIGPLVQADTPATEDDWNDESSPYAYINAKTQAEKEAWELAPKLGVDMVSIVPSRVVGPVLSPHRAGDSVNLVKGLLQGGGWDTIILPLYVHVHDFVVANLRAAETPHAKGRYIVSWPGVYTNQDLKHMLQAAYPELQLPDGLQAINRTLDVTKLQRDLNVYPTQPSVAVIQQARSLIALGLAKSTA